MVITVTCPSCTSTFPVDPAKIPEGGVNARCTQCNDVFRVEKPAEAAPEPVIELPEIPAAPAFETPVVAAEPPPAAVEPVPVEEPTPVAAEPPPLAVEPPPLPEVPALEEPAAAFEEPVAPAIDPTPGFASPPVESDPFAEAAPFEVGSAEAPAPVEDVTAPVEEAAAGAGAAPVQGFTFGKRDPTDKAKRLARVLVSDMIMYNAERHETALAAGTIIQDFEEEIQKSWKEYVEQVGDEMANGDGRKFWTDALNDILAKGQDVF